MKKSLAVLCSSLALALVACSSTGTKEAANSPLQATPAAPAAKDVARPEDKTAAAKMDTRQVATVDSAEALKAKLAAMVKELSAKSVFFDYDDYRIKPEYQETLRKQAEFLSNAPKAALVIEGYADERGSSEYNLALGQKRADAVGKALALQGVANSRFETVSFGKEKPRATCHEEKCWQENRRSDFVIKLQ